MYILSRFNQYFLYISYIMSKPWGYSLHMDLARCNDNIKNADKIVEFSTKLIKKIKMKAYGPPILEHFGEGNKKGYTLVQLIETSCLTAHFTEDVNSMYLDLFSCKEFKENDVVSMVSKYFEPDTISSHFLVRGV